MSSSDELTGSSILEVMGEPDSPPPSLDLGAAARLHRALVQGADAALWRSAHDVSNGGALITLGECAWGAQKPRDRLSELSLGLPKLPWWLCEAAPRVLVSIAPGRRAELTRLLASHGVPSLHLGEVTATGAPGGGADWP